MMAVQSDVKTLLEGSKQFVLPLYQRRYSWTEKHWRTLADDLDRLIREPDRRSHFMGSFVSAPLEAAANQSVSRFRLIDGQQRLTTLIVLLTALRDVAADRGESELADEVHGLYLCNQFKKGDAAKKLLLTEDDRAALDHLLARPAVREGSIGQAYGYFAGRLGQLPTGASLADARRAALGRLAVVSITLEGDDDPHMIFESLNAKGERLTQSDLLRNYFLMRLPQADADEHFGRLWKPMQKNLGDDLTGFFRHYLMRDAEGGDVRRDAVYFHVKERVDRDAPTPAGVVAAMESIFRFGWYYARLVAPLVAEPNPEVRQRVLRLHHLKVTTAYPFLMNVLDAIADDRLTHDAYPSTLGLIETFLVRRLVCGVPTNQLRQIFLGLCRTAVEASDTPTFLAAVRGTLSQKKRCPTDGHFHDALIHRPLYGGSKRELARVVLNQLESSYGHKEAPDVDADNVQIEHVMPQKLTDAWWAELSPGDLSAANTVHEKWLHTLGNLTLTGYNPTLKNDPFAKKRVVYSQSNFNLTKEVALADRWDSEAIESRGKQLADRAVKAWPSIASDVMDAQDIGRRRAARTISVIVDGQSYPISSMIDAAVCVFRAMHDRDEAAFGRAVKKAMPARRRGMTDVGMRTPRQVGDLYLDLHNSGDALQKRCHKLVQAMGLPASTLVFEQV